MAELLKNIYNTVFFELYSSSLSQILPNFKEEEFLQKILDSKWIDLELKQRINHIAKVTNEHLPVLFEDKIEIILALIYKLESKGVKGPNLEFIFLPEIILLNGLEDLKRSTYAMEKITCFTSFEFAIRPYIIKYPEKMMEKLLLWTKHENENVRRLASEACRPRLPWGLRLNQFIKNSAPIIPILEALKADNSLFVRKSVSNNINDISKDHAPLIIDLLKKWKGQNEKTDWIIKHGARTLLKKGNQDVLKIFGNNLTSQFKLNDFTIDKVKIQLGESITFSFSLSNIDNKYAKFRIEYFIYFVKSNKSHSKKIFKISEIELQNGVERPFVRKHRFADLTTRKHYPGVHKIALVVNGVEQTALPFMLVSS